MAEWDAALLCFLHKQRRVIWILEICWLAPYKYYFLPYIDKQTDTYSVANKGIIWMYWSSNNFSLKLLIWNFSGMSIYMVLAENLNKYISKYTMWVMNTCISYFSAVCMNWLTREGFQWRVPQSCWQTFFTLIVEWGCLLGQWLQDGTRRYIYIYILYLDDCVIFGLPNVVLKLAAYFIFVGPWSVLCRQRRRTLEGNKILRWFWFTICLWCIG